MANARGLQTRPRASDQGVSTVHIGEPPHPLESGALSVRFAGVLIRLPDLLKREPIGLRLHVHAVRSIQAKSRPFLSLTIPGTAVCGHTIYAFDQFARCE
jgi:hypothetical protein